MPNTFPILTDGQVCRYPVKRTRSFITGIAQFVDLSEQRWISKVDSAAFVLQYKNISKADRDVLAQFFRDMLGKFGIFDFPFDNHVYEQMVFDQDELLFEESEVPNHYNVTVKIKQNITIMELSDTVQVEFPQINALGVRVQRPWTNGEFFVTTVQDSLEGHRYSYSWLNLPLRKIDVSYPVITDAERDVVEHFFKEMRGKFGQFRYQDPETAVLYFPCRFDQDELEVTYEGPNHNSLKISIVMYV
jgi:hypothetical protein